MFKDGVDPTNVAMEDVLCDFCARPWTDEQPMVEGHRGAMICASCLAQAAAEIDGDGPNVLREGYVCVMSREGDADRAALNRTGEPGWRSPDRPDAAISKACITMATDAIARDSGGP